MTDLEPPSYLNPEGRAIWASYLEEIIAAGRRAAVTFDQLAELVSATQQQRRAVELLAKSDTLIEKGGNPVENPAIGARDSAAAVIRRIRKDMRLGREQRTPIRGPDLIGAGPAETGRYCDIHARWECVHQRSRGRGDCHQQRRLGTNACDQHLGQRAADLPQHQVAVLRKNNPLAGEPYDITPTEALLWRVGVLAGEVRRLDERIAQLQEEELIWGEVSVTETDSDNPVKVTQTGARFHMLLQLRAQRERMLQSACEAAIRAGVEAALVELARDQVAFMKRVILVALERWAGITADDPRIGAELPDIIRAVAG